MAGYKGYSMSNNAILAYECGEKPLSKWTKADIVEAVRVYSNENGNHFHFDINLLNTVPTQILKKYLLTKTSWHHTSKMYNKTDFYGIDEAYIEILNDAKIKEWITDYKKEQEKSKKAPESETWECSYLVWGGTRNHPTATEETAVGEIKGNWFYLSNGTKKSINANGFKKIRRVLENSDVEKNRYINIEADKQIYMEW